MYVRSVALSVLYHVKAKMHVDLEVVKLAL